jgi:hypothetical protein
VLAVWTLSCLINTFPDIALPSHAFHLAALAFFVPVAFSVLNLVQYSSRTTRPCIGSPPKLPHPNLFDSADPVENCFSSDPRWNWLEQQGESLKFNYASGFFCFMLTQFW